MTDTQEPQMPEPAHAAVYYCNKCGHYGKDGPAHANCNYHAVRYGPHYSTEQMRAYAEALAAHRVAQERERYRFSVRSGTPAENDADNDALNAVLHARIGTLWSDDQQPPETGKEK